MSDQSDLVSRLREGARWSGRLENAVRLAERNAKMAGAGDLRAEHFFYAILNAEDGAGPASACLERLPVSISRVRATLDKFLKATGVSAQIKSLQPLHQCKRLLMQADHFRRERSVTAELDTIDLLQAILVSPGSYPSQAVSRNLEVIPGAAKHMAPWEKMFHLLAVEMDGHIWEIPLAGADELSSALRMGSRPWNRRDRCFRYVRNGLFFKFNTFAYAHQDVVRVHTLPHPAPLEWTRWLHRISHQHESDGLRGLSGAQRITPCAFHQDLPERQADFAGRLNREFFKLHSPCGMMREMKREEVPDCEALHQLVIDSGQVPQGFMGEHRKCLEALSGFNFVTELEGEMVGCAGILSNVWEDAKPTEPWLLEDSDRFATLVFGLVHPSHQMNGIGLTQIAFRLILAHHLGISFCRVSATEHSVEYLEKIGFCFWHTHWIRSDAHYMGSVELDDSDIKFLADWLRWPSLPALLASAVSKS